MYSKVFASVSAAGAAGLCSCSRRVHLLSEVAWLPAISMVRKANRLSSCTIKLAGELLFAKLHKGSSGRHAAAALDLATG